MQRSRHTAHGALQEAGSTGGVRAGGLPAGPALGGTTARPASCTDSRRGLSSAPGRAEGQVSPLQKFLSPAKCFHG